jgi:hypothetical protein
MLRELAGERNENFNPGIYSVSVSIEGGGYASTEILITKNVGKSLKRER